MRMLSPWTSDRFWPRRGLSVDSVGDIFEDFDRLFNGTMSTTPMGTVGFLPSCDVKETKEHYVVSLDVPGAKKEDIKIEVKDNRLIVSGERHREQKEGDETTLRYERSYGRFERVFALPASVNTDEIEAHYEDGVLNVAIPKAEAAKGRTVQIQSGQNGFFSRLLSSKKEGSTSEHKDVKIS